MGKPTVLSPGEVGLVVSRCLGSRDIQIEKVSFGPMGSGMRGFMGEYFRTKVVATETRLRQRYHLDFFCKSLPTTSQEHIQYVLSFRAYEKEKVAYTSILPTLRECLASHDRWACEAYLTRPDLLVLENIAPQGFRLHDNLQCLDHAHITLVLKNLAKFHAASLIFEERSSKIEDIYRDVLFENLFSSTEGSSRNWFFAGINAAVNAIQYIPKLSGDPDLLSVIKQKLPDILKQIWELLKPSKKYRNVLCHGDLWNNNIMFRYEDEKPVELRFVDFQMYRYTPPAADVAFFLYITSRRAYREAHVEELLSLYFDALSRELELQGYESEQLLPWTEFRESFDRLRDVGRIGAAISSQLVLMDPEFVAPYTTSLGMFRKLLEEDRNQEVASSILNTPTYRERYLEILEELIESSNLQY